MGVALVMMSAMACQDAEISTDTNPRLISLVPKNVWSGCTAIISGIGFSEDPKKNVVTVDGEVVPVTAATTNRLTLIMPEHADGRAVVTVCVNGSMADNELVTNYAELPAGTFSLQWNVPTYGAEGVEVVLYGEGFSAVPEENTVTVNGVKALVKEAKKTSLIVEMPANPVGEYQFKVKVGARTLTGGTFTYGPYWRLETLRSDLEANTQDIVLDPDGTFWVTRRGNGHGIYKYNPSNSTYSAVSAVSTGLLSGSHPWGADLGADGKLYFAAKAVGKVLTCDKSGNVAQYNINNLTMSNPMKVLVSNDGTLYILLRGASAGQGKVVKVKDNAVQYTWNLTNKAYEMMCFSHDESKIFVFSNNSGDVQMISLSDNSMKKIAGNGTGHSTMSAYTDGQAGYPASATIGMVEGAICAADGTIYFSDVTAKTIRTFSPDQYGDYANGTIKTIAGRPFDERVLSYPNGIALGSDGKTVYFLENNGKICKMHKE